MSALRLLAAGPFVPGREVRLGEEEARHVRARRLAAGDEVVLLDGGGARARGRLTADRGAVLVEALDDAAGEPRRAVTVLLASAEPARVEWAIEKGTECGAAAFRLVAAARSQRAHVTAAGARIERLRRVAAEAAKQCGRTRVPEVVSPASLERAVASAPRPLLVARPGAPAPALGPDALEVALAIGPEGGFAPEEEALFEAAGALAIGLGPRVLRLETAVVAALTLLVDG